jgi:predicted NUDIX family NTP pyrophosphohydrolase
MYVRRDAGLAVLIAHPGGPYWRRKDLGVWSIPKGLPDPGEEPLDTARREFAEETGLTPRPPFLPLTPLRQKSGKTVHCWAFEGEEDPVIVCRSTFEIEWPPRSGKRASFPEIDAARLFPVEEALQKILPGQSGFIHELVAKVK